jgi:hypothetical protein
MRILAALFWWIGSVEKDFTSTPLKIIEKYKVFFAEIIVY